MECLFNDVVLYMDDGEKSKYIYDKLFRYIDFAVSKDKKEIQKLEGYGELPVLKIRTKYYPYDKIIKMIEDYE